MKKVEKMYSNLEIPAPSAGFEDRIISAALAQKKTAASSARVFNFKAYAAACLVVFVVAAAMLAPKTTIEDGTDYASLIDGSAIIDEADVYDDLI